MVCHFLTTANLIKRSRFMLGIQTVSVSDRKLQLATDSALLWFVFCLWKKRQKRWRQ